MFFSNMYINADVVSAVIICAWSEPSGVPPLHFLRVVGTAAKRFGPEIFLFNVYGCPFGGC